ncbi:hypothetical protein K458DRAFT_385013 [Lentithecium fluviatile CBS 122367]|uniref:C2H2-type domain-containing protein n=1 Tax=Lentithecium fluviatile CBS 122367 TaxID=1168545 RepID=A0A6G1JEI1_9PLEO|nr:hypothetical protein K458DRAFT_385013 [Lentithecium fluviatile CBS 122367]
MDSAPLIASRVHLVGGDFVSLEHALRDTTYFSAQVTPEAVKDEFDRFKIWAGNIAAHRKGRRSLEYRLRDAAHLKDETHNLLTALHESLQRAMEIVTGLRKPWDELPDTGSDSGSDVDSVLSQDTTQKNDTELKQLLVSAETTTTCLFRLSMAVRDPAPESQHRSTITIDKSYFEEYDILHVKSKFPACDDRLAERLGRAISGRRRYLSYREEHHKKLAKNVESIGFEETKTEHTTNSTEATSVPTGEDKGLVDDDTLSQTSYASSASLTAPIRVPPLPVEAHEQEQFECPFCFMIVSIHTTAGWKQQVYRDLHPYSCTFDICTTGDRLYDSRHAWFNHELEAHRASWQCVEGCDKTFTAKDDFQDHVSSKHADLASPNMLAALERTSRMGADLSARISCPLCRMSLTLRALKRHLGGHQQQLALFALPINVESTEWSVQDAAQDEDQVSSNSNVDVGVGEIRQTAEEPAFEDTTTPDGEMRFSSSPSGSILDLGEADRRFTFSSLSGGVRTAPTEHPKTAEQAIDEDFPEGTRWTRIDRRLVNPQALQEAGEDFEERADSVFVLRALRKLEIQDLADRTKEIREAREKEYEKDAEINEPKTAPDVDR